MASRTDAIYGNQAVSSRVIPERNWRDFGIFPRRLIHASSGWHDPIMGTIVGDDQPLQSTKGRPHARQAQTPRRQDRGRPEAERAAYRVSEGGGLLLEVRPTGAKLWLCRLTVNGKRRDMGLGGYPETTLKMAREKALAARRQTKDSVDPIVERKAKAEATKAAEGAASEADARTFKAVALVCIKAQSPGWKNSRTADLWTTSLENHAFPTLGAMPVADVDRAAVLRAVDAVWTSRPATARKVLRRIGTVLRYAAAHGWRANDNPADARSAPRGPCRVAGRKRQPSLPWQERQTSCGRWTSCRASRHWP